MYYGIHLLVERSSARYKVLSSHIDTFLTPLSFAISLTWIFPRLQLLVTYSGGVMVTSSWLPNLLKKVQGMCCP
jgi:hypothetical protein